MNTRLSESHARAITGAIGGLGAAGAVAAFISLSLPWAAGWMVVVIGVVVWSYRRTLPTQGQALFVVALALGIGFAVAWYEETRSERVYDYVVIPAKVVAIQYAFPGPHHESTSSSLFGYGEHVEVDCYLQGYDDKPWMALANGNFMPADELTPAELSGEEAPSC